MLSPFVYWGQTESTVSLRVDLKNVQNPQIELSNKVLKFSGRGTGAHGNNQYSFEIEFFEDIEPQDSFYKVIERDIEFVLKKKDSKLWSRLLIEQQKPAWLKVDFDKLHDDDSEDDNVDDWQSTKNSSTRDFGNRNFGRSKKAGSISPEEFRKVYLFLYNLFQLVGFTYMLSILTLRYAVEGPTSMDGSYDSIGSVMKFLHIMQILEVAHLYFGYVKGSAVFPGLQLIYRLFLLFFMIDGEPRMQTKPVVFYLFTIWSLVEVVRYTYYMLHVFDAAGGVLRWLNYTIWVPLVPLSFLCEGVMILRNVPYFDETQRFSLSLPNNWNVAFSMPHFLRGYLLLGLFPTFCMRMTRMYRKRGLVLGAKRRKLD